ncbi:MAG: hypothetical protein PVS3B1_05830 [Ktedonobacteraceae bacterium]
MYGSGQGKNEADPTNASRFLTESQQHADDGIAGNRQRHKDTPYKYIGQVRCFCIKGEQDTIILCAPDERDERTHAD